MTYAPIPLQKDADAIKVAKNILRKDPDFLDVRCALTAFTWAVGDRAAAEDEWQRLQDSQGTISFARRPVALAAG